MEAETENVSHNEFKVRAFKNAIRAIQSLDYPIESAQQIRSLKGVGSGIVKRVDDYLNQHKASPSSQSKAAARLIINELQQVPGVGPTMAKSLYDAGCTSLVQMHQPQYSAMLKPAQRACLPYVSHLTSPVPRAESEAVVDFVRRHIPREFEVVVAGSYRRGAPASSDIDILLFHPSITDIPPPPPPSNSAPSSSPTKRKDRQPKPAPPDHSVDPGPHQTSKSKSTVKLNDVLTELTRRGLLVATMSSGARRWQGIARVPTPSTTHVDSASGKETLYKHKDEDKGENEDEGGKGGRDDSVYRRMDITLFPARAKGAALVACTGDREFNVDLRARASRLELHLNDMGLWRWGKEATNAGASASESTEDVEAESEGSWRWHLLASEDERQILAELGMDWVEPERRNFVYLVDPRKRTSSKMGSGSGSGSSATAKVSSRAASASALVKKGPRRSKKAKEEVVVELESGAETAVKRGRGRPKEVEEDLPESSERGRGRSKVVSDGGLEGEPPRRTLSGRPRKHSDDESYSL
ncbi:Nucleotidyltransferase [Coniophora puteana RWD-64-598 SS2]|uniref:DNA polymerase n=1 Tax=Coniophora puteana (strain RWD-64-598) TaxID=741705 RepID=R7SG10_CONPW|nr:Nucleotidyltransferase [Coniophora puteana RWD-64-598 SS2]EIW74677.1 Nucleotidyltransferase [Coniophora puteana RWD-64-598 SS2]